MKIVETTPKIARTFTLEVSETELVGLKETLGKAPGPVPSGIYQLFCNLADFINLNEIGQS